ncbi:hypothetical protein [Micromonospora sp. MH33]|nr:hypothetical protein [Micromonospora sp. MH33]
MEDDLPVQGGAVGEVQLQGVEVAGERGGRLLDQGNVQRLEVVQDRLG